MHGDASAARVDYDELEYDRNLIFTYQDQLFTGVAYEDVPGKWCTEMTYREGMQEGPSREWYPSGGLKSESYHRENVLHGISRAFDESGRLLSEEIHEYAILISRKKFDATGHVIESFQITPDHQHYDLLERYRRSRHWPTFT